MKIYTKTGDNGYTSIIGGSMRLKSDKQIQAYGDIDELMSIIGYLRSYFISNKGVSKWYVDEHIIIYPEPTLEKIINNLMVCSAITSKDLNINSNIPNLNKSDITFLENEIDNMDKALNTLKNFILPIGLKTSCIAHICRTVCRRAERSTINAFIDNINEYSLVIKYLNRLSDYFFTLARFLNNDKNEIIWKIK